MLSIHRPYEASPSLPKVNDIYPLTLRALSLPPKGERYLSTDPTKSLPPSQGLTLSIHLHFFPLVSLSCLMAHLTKVLVCMSLCLFNSMLFMMFTYAPRQMLHKTIARKLVTYERTTSMPRAHKSLAILNTCSQVLCGSLALQIRS